MVTKRGVIKRSLLTDFEYQRKAGKIAINLDEEDELIFVRHTTGDESLIIATRDGLCVRFDENNVRCMGRGARGVKGITLGEGDYVIGVAVVDEERKLLTITEGGLGKRTEFSDFREMKHRGGKGVTCHKLSEKTGKLASILTVSDNDDIMIITDSGTIIRMSVSDINVYSRTAAGVIVMRLSEDTTIATVTRLEKSEDIEAESREADIALEMSGAQSTPERASLEDFDSEEEISGVEENE